MGNSLSSRLTLRDDGVLSLSSDHPCYCPFMNMDRATIISFLQAGENQIAIIEQQIANQRRLISSLRRAGHDTSSATVQLRVIEQTHSLFIGDRDRLRMELAALNSVEAAKDGASIVSAPLDRLGHRRWMRRTPHGRR